MAIQVDPKNVIGRDELIAQIWRQLRKSAQEGSQRFTAERRVGKTTVMTKMAAEPQEGFDAVFLEVEGIDSPNRFVELLLNRMRPLMSRLDKAKSWFDGFWQNLGGSEVGGIIKLPERGAVNWQAALDKAIEGYCEHRTNQTLLLMLDELPYMLQKIDATSGSGQHEALTMLDAFRALRQRHSNLRMIFAGSVGLHHVLRELRQARLASEPVNNMPLIEIHPLQHDHAVQLAKRLLAAESLAFSGSDQDLIPERLAILSDCVPFYMERTAGTLGLLGRPVTLEDVNTAVQDQLTSDHDPWEMDHFRERIEIYYRGTVPDADGRPITRAAIARCILDHFSVTDEPQSIEDVWAIIRSQLPLTDRQVVVTMLKSLGQDHYLQCDSQKRYSFRFPLVQKWWKTAQGLD
ncbi:MAG: hypothetical protein R3C49_03065 [Planctomycetaceae bacterium]